MLSLTLFALHLSTIFIGLTSAFYPRSEGANTDYIRKFICPTTTHAFLDQSDLQEAMDRFAHIFYIEKDVKGAFDQYVAANYVQHNPNILDGRDEAIESLNPLFSEGGNTFEVIGSYLKLIKKAIH